MRTILVWVMSLVTLFLFQTECEAQRVFRKTKVSIHKGPLGHKVTVVKTKAFPWKKVVVI